MFLLLQLLELKTGIFIQTVTVIWSDYNISDYNICFPNILQSIFVADMPRANYKTELPSDHDCNHLQIQ